VRRAWIPRSGEGGADGQQWAARDFDSSRAGAKGDVAPFALWRRDIWLHSVIGLFVLAYCVSTIAVSRRVVLTPSGTEGLHRAETIPVIAMILCAWRWPGPTRSLVVHSASACWSTCG